ncbi:hypothetical protein TPHA_0C04050 [Tetrapisispora phaffii CBS 4417]|uniref:HECT-type E3 ubiquitin transferase n=1 Tax=Tetrapisispora phaffii (strain ATCC 24235 / CBS 4417 / NBRC 1672 / NRRL Y-8282 / UCD 70-5) TaxID=1071381 RepID=G8BQP3_TETPH|nr:hypothetical protein TPHA_0C04050 [Tetrapisispora phaffii CBS 4417]CCE62555.1 hypothetical protein TPHA_0C04050 [Tetrapisispora phaffii CBS 4417]
MRDNHEANDQNGDHENADDWDYSGNDEGDEHSSNNNHLDSIDYDDYYDGDELQDDDDADEMPEDEEEDENDYNHESDLDGEIDMPSFRGGAAVFEELLGNMGNSHTVFRRNAERQSGSTNGDSDGITHIDDDNTETSNTRQIPGNIQDLFSMFQNNMFTGAIPGAGNSGRVKRLKKLVDNIVNAEEDPYIAMESLRELSEQLLMMNQIVIDRVLPVEELLESLINIFRNPLLIEQLELQLMAGRCLHSLFEVDPDCMSIAIEKDIVVTLQSKLEEISYIDLAEQVLETLEYISRVHCKDILEAGNLLTYIQFFDFFTIHAQRKAISCIVNACSKLEIKYFPIIQEIMPLLQTIFLQNVDDNIMTKLINIICCICAGLNKHFNFDELFTIETANKIIYLISSYDLSVDNKVKCIDILSIFVIKSEAISLGFLNSNKAVPMVLKCIENYENKTHAKDNESETKENTFFNETLMFVPDNLLISLSRFLTVLLPEEPDNSLTHANALLDKSKFKKDELQDMLLEMIPILIGIYINTVDYSIKSYASLALLRSICQLNSASLEAVKEKIVLLFEPSFFKMLENNIHLTNNKLETYISLELLTILVVLFSDFEAIFMDTIKKEGILDYIKSLYYKIELLDVKEINQMDVDSENETNNARDEFNNDSDNDSAIQHSYDEMNVPDFVKPKLIKFDIFRYETQAQMTTRVLNMSNFLYQKVKSVSVVENDKISAIKNVLNKLKQYDIQNYSYNDWVDIWTLLKSTMFKNGSNISSYELTTSGLLKTLVEVLSSSDMHIKRFFLEVFESKLEELVSILQSALSKLEDISILESGLQGDEGGISSLSKEVEVQLVYKSDGVKDNIPINLRSVKVSIHSIASLKMLNDFLKHKVAQSMFLTSLLPGFKNETTNSENAMASLKNIDFKFSIGENKFSSNETIFGAIYRHWTETHNETNLNSMWLEVPTIYYEKVEEDDDDETEMLNNISNNIKPKFDGSLVEDLLEFLKILKDSKLPNELFINSKISGKLSRQLDEPLIVASGVLPSWVLQLTKNYHFLFPFDIRMFYLQCSSFGYGRLIERWLFRSGRMKDQSSDNPLQQLGTLTKNKVKLSRDNLFASGLKTIDKYGSNRNTLEIEYIDEEGTGLGPTLEFYASMSLEFAKPLLDIWLCDEEVGNTDTKFIEQELFPKPLSTCSDANKTIELFRILGKFIAKSMLDGRIVDFRFKEVFFQLLHERIVADDTKNSSRKQILYSLDILSLVDTNLSQSLKYLYNNMSDNDIIKGLDLNFVLPGKQIVEIIDGGNNILVTSDNVEKYITGVIDQMLYTGIEKQLDAFIKGFSECFPYKNLLILTPKELVELFGKEEEDWSESTLYSSIKAEHGYTMDSQTVHDLINILKYFNINQRRLFSQFLTGSPKLPIGGFKCLKPKLTVVLKTPEDNLTPDQVLPSVMTCANYLKLPKYSSKEILKSRIDQAMREGSGAFLLS